MTIESFSNELFMNVFTYLSTTDLFGAFYGLNGRFESLLSAHCYRYGLDFQGISRSNFDTICQTYLPHMVDQIPSIRFNNDERTPGQIDQFYSHGLRLDQFTHLQTLSILYLRSEDLAYQLMLEIQTLPNLINLTYKPFYLPLLGPGAKYFINCIWQLKKLQYCRVAFKFNNFLFFPIPMIESTSLKFLFSSYLPNAFSIFLNNCSTNHQTKHPIPLVFEPGNQYINKDSQPL